MLSYNKTGMIRTKYDYKSGRWQKQMKIPIVPKGNTNNTNGGSRSECLRHMPTGLQLNG